MRLLILPILVSVLACASRPSTVPNDTGESSRSSNPGETSRVPQDTTKPETVAKREPVDPESVPLSLVTPEEFRALMDAPGAKAVLVNVWATWCDPCREEFPDLIRIRDTYGPKGLRVLFLSADFDDEEEDVTAFLAEQGVDFETYLRMGEDHAFIEAIDPDWGGTLPATLVLGANGERLLFREGLVTYDELDDLLSRHL